MSKTKAWFNLLRLSNTPTLISNVMVGFGLGISAYRVQWSDATIVPNFSPLVPLLIITFALLCAYFSGLVLNDAKDFTHDKKHRPNRPLPKGIISKKEAWIVGISLLASAVLISTFAEIRSAYLMLLLSVCILNYTYFHRFLIPALLFMGICRGLVYLVACSAFDVEMQPQVLLVFGLGIAWYTVVLTFIARNEEKNNTSKSWLVFLLLPAAYVPALLYYTQFQMIWIVLSLGIFSLWTAFTFVIFQITQKNVHGIHMMLAGFCLLDVVYLCVVGEVPIAIVSGLCLLLTVAAQRKILGT
jgi:heme O synthase-like polyprenyltransferase